MANYNSLSALFTAIADSIRTKLGTEDDIVATDFPDKIDEITTVPAATQGTLTIRCVLSTAGDGNGSAAVAYPTVENGQYIMKVSTIQIGESITVPLPYYPDYSESTSSARPRFAVLASTRGSWYIDYNYGGSVAYFSALGRSRIPSLYSDSSSDYETTALLYTSFPSTDEPYNAVVTIPLNMK